MRNNHFSSRSPGPYSNNLVPKQKFKERRSLDPSALIHDETKFRSPLLTSNNIESNNQNGNSFSRSRGLRRRHSFVTPLKEEVKVNGFPEVEMGLTNRGNFISHRSLRLSLHKLKLKAVKNEPNNEDLGSFTQVPRKFSATSGFIGNHFSKNFFISRNLIFFDFSLRLLGKINALL